MPSDKEGALVVRCREVKGWFGRDSHWVMVVWVWSKTGTIPENPGNIEIDSECRWSVEREAGPSHAQSPAARLSQEARFKPHAEPPPK